MRLLILGAGEVGRHLARSLSHEANVVLLDSDSAALAIAEEELDVLVMEGDATHRHTLEQAEVADADLVVSVAGHDSVNVAAGVLAKNLGARRVAARVDDPGFYRGPQGVEREVAGIDACVCSSRLVGVDLLRLVNEVEVGWTATFVGGATHVCVVEVGETTPLLGESVNRSSASSLTRGILRGTGLRMPHECPTLEVGDRIVLAGPPVDVAAEARILQGSEPRRVVVIGGGAVGLQLARALSDISRDLSIVEGSRRRCEELAAVLPKTTVLHGDGTNLSFLREERVGAAGTVLAVTGSDEVNLMASLLSGELGTDHTFALVHRPGYASVYAHLGINGTSSAHEVLATTIQWLLPDRTIVRARSIPDSEWEVLELRLPYNLGRTLRARDVSLGAHGRILAVLDHDEPTIKSEANPPLTGGEHLLVAAPANERRTIARSVAALGGSNR